MITRIWPSALTTSLGKVTKLPSIQPEAVHAVLTNHLGAMESATTSALLRRSAYRCPDRVAVRFLDQTLTYLELNDLADRLASGLRRLGAKHGTKIAILLHNRTEYLVAYHAVTRLGAIFVPLVTQSKPAEVEYVLEHSEASFLITEPALWADLRLAKRLDRTLAKLVGVILTDTSNGGEHSWDAVVASGEAGGVGLDTAVDDLAAFIYTSGTTGRPKAVMQTHFSAVAQAHAVSTRLGYTPSHTIMTVFPLFHGNALIWSALASACAGAELVVTPRFSASRFWDDVRRYRVTEVNLLLGAVNMLLAQPPSVHDKEHPLKLVMSTINESVYQRFTERFGVDVVTLWALAEGALGTMAAPGYGYTPNLIGWPLGDSTEVEIFDEVGNSAPAYSVGELVLRTPAAMVGYYKNPDETARVLRGGWVHSGDLGYRDSEGLFYFSGRIKNIIRRSGENVSAEEVEGAIISHPSVAECAVVPVKDDIRDEEVRAFLVLCEGATLTADELHTFISEMLSDFKVPRYIEFRPELPKTGPDKIALDVLRREPLGPDCWDYELHRTKRRQ